MSQPTLHPTTKRNSLGQLIQSISSWSLPAKFLASAALSALGGAGVLSYLVEYATYSYALAFGFRPPVEGIPYLTTTVAAGSLFLLISGAAIAATMLFCFGTVAGHFGATTNPLHLKLISKYKAASKSRRMVILLSVVILLCLAGFYAGPELCRVVPLSGCAAPLRHRLLVASGAGIAGLVILTSIGRPATVWWFVAGYTSVYYAIAVALMFQPSAYAKFLRFTGFGGGVPVTLHLDEGVTDSSPRDRAAFLMLRTANAFIVFSPRERRFEEYPIEKVLRLSYSTGGMHLLPYQLPE